MTPDEKLIFLRLLLENKDVLFGRLARGEMSHIKGTRWNEVRQLCIDQGFDPMPPGKNQWPYLRDKVFTRMKERTKKRLEMVNEGKASVKDVGFSEQDRLVLELLGKKRVIISNGF